MRLCVILFLLLLSSCISDCKRRVEISDYQLQQVNQLTDSLSQLRLEYEKSEVYLLTAETYQVTRSPEETERQLKNLHAYRNELENKIQIMERQVRNYSDSLRHR